MVLLERSKSISCSKLFVKEYTFQESLNKNGYQFFSSCAKLIYFLAHWCFSKKILQQMFYYYTQSSFFIKILFKRQLWPRNYFLVAFSCHKIKTGKYIVNINVNMTFKYYVHTKQYWQHDVQKKSTSLVICLRLPEIYCKIKSTLMQFFATCNDFVLQLGTSFFTRT